MSGEWGRRLTRFLAGGLLGEPNEMRRPPSSLDDEADLKAAWDELRAATPAGWFVERPGLRHGGQWAVYAFDTTERAAIGKRSREWTAVGQTEVECVREMARCLRESEWGSPR